MKISRSQVKKRGNTLNNPFLIEHTEEWAECKRCSLYTSAFHHVLYEFLSPEKPLPLDVLFCGEGPGNSEDIIGRPFIGRSGKILRQCIDKSFNMRYNRYNIAIINLVACRPCNGVGTPNREPMKEEIDQCADRIVEFVQLTRPKIVVCLGRVPQSYLPGIILFQTDQEPEFINIYHPSYIERSGGIKSAKFPAYQEEFEKIRRKLDG